MKAIHAQLLALVGNGADVFDREIAGLAREWETEGLVEVFPSALHGEYHSVGKIPYFHARVTTKGWKAVEEWQATTAALPTRKTDKFRRKPIAGVLG